MSVITGGCLYQGKQCLQHESYADVFRPFLLKENFTKIIEIGTCNGGLTLFLKHTSPNSQVVSYDVQGEEELKFLKEAGVDFRCKNVFSQDYQRITDQEFLDEIRYSGKLLVLVDGGNKAGEFNVISDYLRTGDFIMCHDYVTDRATFEAEFKEKIWNWCEITENDIRDSSIRNNLIQVYPEFNSVVWQCKKKVK